MTISQTVSRIETLRADWPDNTALQCFDLEYFSTLCESRKTRLLNCLRSGIENPDSEMGCYACQPTDYDDFQPFFSQVLARHHGVPEDARQVNDWNLGAVDGLPDDGRLDLRTLGLSPVSMRVRVGRNLSDLPLPGSMSRTDRVRLEEKMMAAFATFIERIFCDELGLHRRDLPGVQSELFARFATSETFEADPEVFPLARTIRELGLALDALDEESRRRIVELAVDQRRQLLVDAIVG